MSARLDALEKISIHAPREGCDGWTTCLITRAVISIHAPREGCDTIGGAVSLPVAKFQSTHPVRGATAQKAYDEAVKAFQSTHPVRGATLWKQANGDQSGISIHAPREGCDRLTCQVIGDLREFQSTHPVRGATEAAGRVVLVLPISIHAPREGCDPRVVAAFRGVHDFNPRTP